MNKEIVLATNILKRVYIDGAYASIELNKNKKPDVNYGLITKIVYGVIERDVSLEYIIKPYVKKAPDEIVMLYLKIGTYIGTFLNSIPKYTIVNELVNIAKKNDIHTGGFVNATLKNILNGKIVFPNKDQNLSLYLSIKYSFPLWVINKYIAEFGQARTMQLLETKLTTMTHIRLNGINASEFESIMNSAGIEYQKTNYDDTYYVDYKKLLDNNYSKYCFVQGLPSIVTARNMGIKSGDKVLDLCSAPGGKVVLMASDHKDAQFVACDIYEHRVQLVKDYVRYANLTNVQCQVVDGTIANNDFVNQFDRVLVDAPCSGLGVVNKKPDILLNRKEESIKELSAIQTQILENASKYVKDNGTIIYSTCSILRDENEKVVLSFLAKHSEFALQKIDTQGIKSYNNDEMITFSPEISNVEGFFLAKLIKKGNK